MSGSEGTEDLVSEESEQTHSRTTMENPKEEEDESTMIPPPPPLPPNTHEENETVNQGDDDNEMPLPPTTEEILSVSEEPAGRSQGHVEEASPVPPELPPMPITINSSSRKTDNEPHQHHEEKIPHPPPPAAPETPEKDHNLDKSFLNESLYYSLPSESPENAPATPDQDKSFLNESLYHSLPLESPQKVAAASRESSRERSSRSHSGSGRRSSKSPEPITVMNIELELDTDADNLEPTTSHHHKLDENFGNNLSTEPAANAKSPKRSTPREAEEPSEASPGRRSTLPPKNSVAVEDERRRSSAPHTMMTHSMDEEKVETVYRTELKIPPLATPFTTPHASWKAGSINHDIPIVTAIADESGVGCSTEVQNLIAQGKVVPHKPIAHPFLPPSDIGVNIHGLVNFFECEIKKETEDAEKVREVHDELLKHKRDSAGVPPRSKRYSTSSEDRRHSFGSDCNNCSANHQMKPSLSQRPPLPPPHMAPPPPPPMSSSFRRTSTSKPSASMISYSSNKDRSSQTIELQTDFRKSFTDIAVGSAALVISRTNNVRDLIQDDLGTLTDLESLEELDTFIKSAGPGVLVVVDFFADWCKPCFKMVRVLQNLAEHFSTTNDVIKFAKLDVKNCSVKEIIAKYGVKEVPAFVFFKDAKQLAMYAGGKKNSKNVLLELISKYK